VQVALEAFGGRQAIQDVLLLVGRERRRRARRFEALLPPALLLRSLMYMYSAPIVPQYVSRRPLTMSRSEAWSKPKYRLLALYVWSRSPSEKS
jgi:hypothetical protein